VGNFPSRFGHTRLLGSRIIRYVRDRWTDRRTDGRKKATLTEHCWHIFMIKNATVKQVTLNVTDRDKINIVSSQIVREVSLKTSYREFQAESCKFLITILSLSLNPIILHTLN